MNVKFAHTNIVSKDWTKLAEFYIKVFGCEPVYPERDLQGSWVDKLTAQKKAHIRGIHLKLPGYTDGPTLEIFQYNSIPDKDYPKLINQPGFAHLAFLVDDVYQYLNKLLQNGGSKLGEVVEKDIENVGFLTAVYARDPEGNIIEIQSWEKNT